MRTQSSYYKLLLQQVFTDDCWLELAEEVLLDALESLWWLQGWLGQDYSDGQEMLSYYGRQGMLNIPYPWSWLDIYVFGCGSASQIEQTGGIGSKPILLQMLSMNCWLSLIFIISSLILVQQKNIWLELLGSLINPLSLLISSSASWIFFSKTYILFLRWTSIFFITSYFCSALRCLRRFMISSLAFLKPASPYFTHASDVNLYSLSTPL